MYVCLCARTVTCKWSLPIAGEVNTFSGVIDGKDMVEDVVDPRKVLGGVCVCECVCVRIVVDVCDGDRGSLYTVDEGEWRDGGE